MTDASIERLMPQRAKGNLSAVATTEAITARSGTSFSAGMAILPRPRREAMRALYAFCRVVDDVADGDHAPADKHAALDAWRDEVEALYQGRPASAIGQALLAPVAAFGLPQEEFVAMIDGMAQDADGPIVAPSRSELATYTRRVAGSVGILSMRVFGAWRGTVSDRFALALADALQLTNILRDVAEDARIGRLYLPREALEAVGVPLDPSSAALHPDIALVRRDVGAAARDRYDRARFLSAEHDRASLRPALMMMGAYEGYLDAMEARGWDDLTPPFLPRRSKLLRGLRYAVLGPGAPARSATVPAE